MHCKHCGFVNGEDDHRCLRCGRRLSGVVIAAPPGYSGANALAPAVMMSDDTAEFPPVQQAAPAQPTLFANYSQRCAERNSLRPARAAVDAAAANAGCRRAPASRQCAQVPRSPVRHPRHAGLHSRVSAERPQAQDGCRRPGVLRSARGDADASPGGFGDRRRHHPVSDSGCWSRCSRFWAVVSGPARRCGSGWRAALALVSMLYGLIWAIAGRETAGMRFTDLQLITFDGFQVDPRSRALRFASTWLSFCSGGLGLLWAVADEENLTWHDHISKTFPTIREMPGTFVRQRR